jgi:hypothetical protein
MVAAPAMTPMNSRISTWTMPSMRATRLPEMVVASGGDRLAAAVAQQLARRWGVAVRACCWRRVMRVGETDYDRVIADERRTAVLITPERGYFNG